MHQGDVSSLSAAPWSAKEVTSPWVEASISVFIRFFARVSASTCSIVLRSRLLSADTAKKHLMQTMFKLHLPMLFFLQTYLLTMMPPLALSSFTLLNSYIHICVLRTKPIPNDAIKCKLSTDYFLKQLLCDSFLSHTFDNTIYSWSVLLWQKQNIDILQYKLHSSSPRADTTSTFRNFQEYMLLFVQK